MKKNETTSSLSFSSRLKKGDRSAFKEIFNTYYQRLYAFSLNYVEDKFAAEEIVENVFIKLWDKRRQIQKIGNLKSYLYQMTRNQAIDYLKKEKKHVSLNIDTHDYASKDNTYIIEEETHALLFKALDLLPEKCRKVFELSCIEGIKYKDIAEDLQISINTVKSQRARAIELLKAHLKNHPIYQVLLSSL